MPSLKAINDQAIVITGGSSGIGLATAKAAVEAGAKVIIAARNGSALQQIVEPLQIGGAEIDFVEADVSKPDDVKSIAAKAIERFGRIDTWVNVAGVDIWGKLTDLPDMDARRLFETNFWGVVNGSLAAVEAMRGNPAGALITVGSVAGDRAFPMQGMYCASKHAVKAYTDALRIELQADAVPISVTLIKPSSIGTPLQKQAKNFMDREPRLPSPLYAPEEVANAILHAATHPVRDIHVGSAGWLFASLGTVAPAFSDWVGKTLLIGAQQRSRNAAPRIDNLHQAGPGGGEVRHDPEGRAMRPSFSTRWNLQDPLLKAAVLLGAAGLFVIGSRGRHRGRRERTELVYRQMMRRSPRLPDRFSS